MRRSGFAAIFLVIVIAVMSFSTAAFAVDGLPEEPARDAAAPTETAPAEPAPSEDPGEDAPEPSETPTAEPTDEPKPSEEPSAEPSEEPTEEPTAEPTEEIPATPEPSAEPTADESAVPSADPEPTQAPAPSSEAPTLEMASGQTIYLNQETPAIKIRWRGGIPQSVAGYVWSFAKGSNPHQVFYVTYDPNSTALAAGALNGHIDSAGTYTIYCQPVDSAQQSAGPAAQIDLHVAESACELTISASESFPVAAGSEITLTADAGSLSDQVTRYEWKPAGSSSGSRTCRIGEVAAGPVRYTCTAVLRSGQRVTGTLVVTGTELIASKRSVTIDNGSNDTLSVAWSNGSPRGSIWYSWSVRGEGTTDLSSQTGSVLSAKYLSSLKARSNPYTISCQAYSGKSARIGSPATFQVRIAGSGAGAGEAGDVKIIAGDENGRVPNTEDSAPIFPQIMLAAAAALLLTWAVFSVAVPKDVQIDANLPGVPAARRHDNWRHRR